MSNPCEFSLHVLKASFANVYMIIRAKLLRQRGSVPYIYIPILKYYILHLEARFWVLVSTIIRTLPRTLWKRILRIRSWQRANGRLVRSEIWCLAMDFELSKRGGHILSTLYTILSTIFINQNDAFSPTLAFWNRLLSVAVGAHSGLSGLLTPSVIIFRRLLADVVMYDWPWCCCPM